MIRIKLTSRLQTHPQCSRCAKDGASCTYDQNPDCRKSSVTRHKRSWNRIGKSSETAKDTPRQVQGTSQKPAAADNEPIPGLGYLSLQRGGRSRYVGRSFWAFVDENARLPPLRVDSVVKLTQPSIPTSTCYSKIMTSTLPPRAAPEMRDNMAPTSPAC